MSLINGTQMILFMLLLISDARRNTGYNRQPPRIDYDKIRKNPIVYPTGSSINLKCPVIVGNRTVNLRKLFVDWAHDGTPLNSYGNYRITTRGVLKIRTANIHHSGLYTCKAVNGFGHVYANITIKVVDHEDLIELNPNKDNYNGYPYAQMLDEESVGGEIGSPSSSSSSSRMVWTVISSDGREKAKNYLKFVKVSPSPENYRPVGSSIRLICNVEGFPEPQLHWLKDGHLLTIREMPKESIIGRQGIIIRNLRVQDEANYTCMAHNIFSTINSTFSIHVIDHKKQHKLEIIKPSNISANIGENVKIKCEVTSSSKPYIQWLKPHPDAKSNKEDEAKEEIIRSHDLINIHGRYYRSMNPSIVFMEEDNDRYYNELAIKNIKQEDGGEYICLAVNLAGYSRQSAYITIQTNPIRSRRIRMGNDEIKDDVNSKRIDSDGVGTYMLTIIWVLITLVVSLIMLCTIRCKFPAPGRNTAVEIPVMNSSQRCGECLKKVYEGKKRRMRKDEYTGYSRKMKKYPYETRCKTILHHSTQTPRSSRNYIQKGRQIELLSYPYHTYSVPNYCTYKPNL